MILILITAVVISIFLERQERRHRFELEVEERRLGRNLPRPPPARGRGEPALGFASGGVLTAAGIALLWISFSLHSPELSAGTVELVALTLGSGVALLILGGKGLRRKRRGPAEAP